MKIENGCLTKVYNNEITGDKFIIPEGVTSIGNEAFYACSSLKSITIPNSVMSIGKYAFERCIKLKSITVPNSVTSIGASAFYNCRGLTSVTIGNGVTSIGMSAFENCSRLTSVTIGNSVKSIGACAFEGCNKLTSFTIPNSVKDIGVSVFSECSSLASVTIGNGLTSIEKAAFKGCSRLLEVYITDLSAWCKIKFNSFDSNPLYYAKNLYINNELATNLVIPDGVTSIGDFAFYGFSGLTSVTIPDSVTSIGYVAFYYCRGLRSVTIGNGVTSIGEGAFFYCSLTSKQANYKAFRIENGELYCHGKTYSNGKRHYVRGALKICKNGIHYCTNLFEIFNYYYGELDKDIVIYEIEVGSKVLTSDSSKCCTNSCVLKRRLYHDDIIKILNGE